MIRRMPRAFYLLVIILFLLNGLNRMMNHKTILKFYLKTLIESNEIASILDNPLHLLRVRVYPEVESYELKDWHDYQFMEQEANRTGLGENGTEVILHDVREIKINDELREIESLNVYISDKISINRSIPDVRHEMCKQKLFLKHLPHVSVVVILHNEHLSLVQRTLHSIYNRTPRELLKEIILVNDASTKEGLHEKLKVYIGENFNGRVKLVKLETRVGLIVARMEGARRATSEVLVFLDSHIEVNVNWLPPLLEPIAINPRACTTPIIDQYNWLTWKYEVHARHGVRGLFAWDFDYRMTPQKKSHPTAPKVTPIMLGCAFAINRQYFWDLGGYDDQLLIWNAENYELSFKLWLCGGELLECPCSRVAHVFRRHNEFRRLDGVDFVGRNFKRIAEVWMDEWKEFLYKTDPIRYKNIDAGDLTKQKMVRRQLKCKPFNYFIHHIAPEILKIVPIPKPEDIAYGVLSTFFNASDYCISDYQSKGEYCTISSLCNKPRNMPHCSQYFHLSQKRGIEHERSENCFRNLKLPNKKSEEDNVNRWNYDFKTNQIIHRSGIYCVSADFVTHNLTLDECDISRQDQKWHFGYVNKTMHKV